ncbi:MAG: hypothetical protein AAF745_03135 [Planctomycetota bacterium]
MFLRLLATGCVLVVMVGVPTRASATLTFNLNFTDNALAAFDASEQALFQQGLDFWDGIIDGHQDGVSRTWTIEVDAFDEAPVNGAVRLGFAGPRELFFSNQIAGAPLSNERYILPGAGIAVFNVNPAVNLRLDTIKHEFAHGLGVGTLWEDNEVYNDGIAGNSNRTLPGGIPGQYVGANALATFQQEFVGQSSATFIPVELAGGAGTAHGHWDEADNLGVSPTGIVDFDGNDLRSELMTGFLADGPIFLADFTVQSLVDLGYTLEATAIPEPSSVLACVLATIWLAGRRRSPTILR